MPKTSRFINKPARFLFWIIEVVIALYFTFVVETQFNFGLWTFSGVMFFALTFFVLNAIIETAMQS